MYICTLYYCGMILRYSVMYIYMYMYMCFVHRNPAKLHAFLKCYPTLHSLNTEYAHTHAHTHMYMYVIRYCHFILIFLGKSRGFTACAVSKLHIYVWCSELYVIRYCHFILIFLGKSRGFTACAVAKLHIYVWCSESTVDKVVQCEAPTG